jgi:biopolymer transport protein ExbD
MAFRYKKSEAMTNLNLIPMIDITSFILLSLAILTMSMKKEASLDNILQLPPVLHAAKQDTTQLQIYILPATILRGGYIMPDSTGLVAFTGKGGIPLVCDSCGLAFRDKKTNEYVPNTLLDQSGKPIASMKSDVGKEGSAAADSALAKARPPAYWCSSCHKEISPYLKLDDIPKELAKKKKEIVKQLVDAQNNALDRLKKPHMTEEEVKKVDENIPLMIKADDRAFYGRILQVVNTVKADTTCKIKKFAFVTLAEASLEAQKKDIMSEKKGGKK